MSEKSVVKKCFWEADDFHNNIDKKEMIIMEPPQLKRRREDSESGDNDDDDDIEPMDGPHPLLIDHVIENLLEYSPNFVKAVKQFRLVCKQWNFMATKKYRSNLGRICFENDFNRKTSKFIQVMSQTKDMLFDKFRFSGGFVVYKPYQGHYHFDRIFNELFRTCVPYMKTLEFTSHNPSDLKFPKNVGKYDLSNLSTLSFHICVFYSNLQMEMTDYLGAILDAASNLKTADFRLVSADPSLQSDDQLKIISRFGDVVANRIPKTCKNLKLNMMMNENHIRLLEERDLHLECLIIDFQKVILSTKVIESFLKSQSNSLQHLELVEAPIHSGMELPILPYVSFVKIEGKPRVPSFKFDTVFPRLKSIEIIFYWIYQEDAWLQDVLVDSGQSSSISDVEFLCEINEGDLFVLYRILKCFPQMKRLSVVINSSKALSTLFSTMTFIEDLEISLAREFWEYRGPGRMGKVDQAFCGIPAEHCLKLLRENEFENTDLPATLGEASVRDLKKLRKLKIRGYRADQIPLTDVTVHFGLMKMQSLVYLILDIFPISKQCLRTLAQHVRLQLLPGPIATLP